MSFKTKSDYLFIVLAAFFVTNAIVAELISSKLIEIPISFGSWHLHTFTMIVGIIPWPVVFLTTDLINEYYGAKVVRKLSVITACMIGYTFIILFGAINIPAIQSSPASDEQFNAVFRQSQLVIVGSIAAFMVSQLLDSFIFWIVRQRTGERMIWLRSTGSTVISQFFDSYIVLGIGFLLPGKMSWDLYLKVGLDNYLFKLIIAVLLTPLIYLGHSMAGKYLGKEAKKSIKDSAEESLHHKVEE
jgi:uncharacterized integral membrane protein (TIGR00697 family)